MIGPGSLNNVGQVAFWFTASTGDGLNRGLAVATPIPTTPCNPADLAPDFGSLDFADINAFVSAFLAGDAAADLNDDTSFDFLDINAFVAAFLTGCP